MTAPLRSRPVRAALGATLLGATLLVPLAAPALGAATHRHAPTHHHAAAHRHAAVHHPAAHHAAAHRHAAAHHPAAHHAPAHHHTAVHHPAAHHAPAHHHVAARHGVTALPARAVVTRAATNVRTARTLVLSGTLRLGHGRFGFRVESTAHGRVARGTLVSHTAAAGFVGSLEFVERPGTMYVRAGAPFWRHEVVTGAGGLTAAQKARASRALARRWVEMRGAAARTLRASVGPLVDPATFARQMLSAKALGSLHKGRVAHFHRWTTLPVVSNRGGTVYVTVAGATRPIGLVAKGRSGGGTILFSYPKHLVVRAPAGASTITDVVRAVAQ